MLPQREEMGIRYMTAAIAATRQFVRVPVSVVGGVQIRVFRVRQWIGETVNTTNRAPSRRAKTSQEDGEARTHTAELTGSRGCGAMASGMPGHGNLDSRVAATAEMGCLLWWTRMTHERFPQSPLKIWLPGPS